MVAAFGVGVFGNVTMIGVVTLLQSITPDYQRGRIMGLNSMINTSTGVGVNLMIWLTPDADRILLIVLLALGPVLMTFGLFGLYRVLTRGPLRDRISNVLWHLLRLYTIAWHRVRWIDAHHVPGSGPVLMALNHTTGIDTISVQGPIRRRIRWLMTEPYKIKPLNFIWRRAEPIALAEGTSNTGKIRSIVHALEAGDPVGIFPEGILGRKDRTLKKLQPGVVMVAKRSGAPVVPVWIAGSPRAENMFWHFALPSHTTVRFGEPYYIAEETGTKEALEDLRERLEALREASERD